MFTTCGCWLNTNHACTAIHISKGIMCISCLPAAFHSVRLFETELYNSFDRFKSNERLKQNSTDTFKSKSDSVESKMGKKRFGNEQKIVVLHKDTEQNENGNEQIV